MNTFLQLFSRRYWWGTLLAIVGVILLIRLGIWQLDRLEQRRAFNTRVAERWQMEPYDVSREALPTDLSELEYRRVQAEGNFDYANQIVLKEQTYGDVPGLRLVTPLDLGDGRAILVVRGWVPYGQDTPDQLAALEEPAAAPVVGLLQESQLLPNGAAPTVPDTPQHEWFYLNIDAIQPQMPYQLLPVFILMLPEAGRAFDALPIRDEPLTLTEGNHFSYAIQWFTFALILGVGYIFLVRYWEMRRARLAHTPELAALDLPAIGPVEHTPTELEPAAHAPNAGEPAPPTLETSR